VSEDAAPGTGQDTELAGVFEQNRRHLRAIAYRMLGSLPEADDAVQDTWMRFAAAGTEGVANVSGWLTTILTRACLNLLRARAARPEQPAPPPAPARSSTASLLATPPARYRATSSAPAVSGSPSARASARTELGYGRRVRPRSRSAMARTETPDRSARSSWVSPAPTR